MRFGLSALATVILLGTCGCTPADRPAEADLVLRGGRVVTVDPQLPEATAFDHSRTTWSRSSGWSASSHPWPAACSSGIPAMTSAARLA